MRTALLALAAALALAGCVTAVGPAGTGTPTPPPTETPTVSPTPDGTPQPCDAARPDPPDPYRDDVEPSEYPDAPEEMTATKARAYVVGFEKAYSRNDRLSRISTEVVVYVSEVRVDSVGDGWRVSLVSQTNTWAAGTDTSDGTPTVVHGDGARIPVVYHVTDGALYRLELGHEETAAPGERGEIVACFG